VPTIVLLGAQWGSQLEGIRNCSRRVNRVKRKVFLGDVILKILCCKVNSLAVGTIKDYKLKNPHKPRQ
jgi:hypothetical protein